jgi:hypothetical protein
MRGIHKHPRSTAIMDGPNKSGHDGEGWNGAANPHPNRKCFSSSPRMDCMWV